MPPFCARLPFAVVIILETALRSHSPSDVSPPRTPAPPPARSRLHADRADGRDRDHRRFDAFARTRLHRHEKRRRCHGGGQLGCRFDRAGPDVCDGDNTFVWMGFKEVDASRDSSASSQNVGVGRVAVAIVASKDGTRGYDVNSPSAWRTNYNNGSNLVAITKLQRFENVHLATTLNGYGNQPPTSGNMARPYVISNNYDIGNAPATVTPFDWPLGSNIDAGQYSFKKVINFDPQGVLRIQYASNADFIGQYLEVGLQETHGTSVSSSSNVAAVQMNCVSGTVRKYRP